MFGRKKKDLPAGARMMHYEGLRGFSQDGPCFMERPPRTTPCKRA